MQHHPKTLNLLLRPFALMYGCVVALRNKLYDIGTLKQYQPTQPTLVVGNLSVGGTGKSPMVEYLIELLINNNKQVTTISRGYGRISKGFKQVELNSLASQVGDEPLQFKQKFKQACTVIVDEKRTNALQLLAPASAINTVYVLDDAYQHRAVKGSLNILLTTYTNLYCDDYMLPAGNLREFTNGSNRANVIIVTKCPATIDIDTKNTIKHRLNIAPHQNLFFSTIHYDACINIVNNTLVNLTKTSPVISFAGIANDAPFVNYLQQTCTLLKHVSYKDHHSFSTNDIETLQELIDKHTHLNPVIVTTHKDAMRLLNMYTHFITKNDLVYLPTKMYFSTIEQQQFNNLIITHVNNN
jgi:tetraacyldisaccharide 4'-kinase